MNKEEERAATMPRVWTGERVPVRALATTNDNLLPGAK